MPQEQKRFRMLEDRLEILDLEGAYGPAYDSGDAERWAELFTSDGIYQGQRIEGAPEPNYVRGRANLIRFCREQPSAGMHTMHTPQITLNGDHATGRIHFQFQSVSDDAHGGTDIRRSTGAYDVSYVRTPDGWRMSRRITAFLEVSLHSLFGRYPAPADLAGPSPYDDDIEYVDRRS